jgi:hypothetical protein
MVQPKSQQEGGPGQGQVAAHHEAVAVGEVDHGENAVDRFAPGFET